MFRVKTKGFDQEYERWTDALDRANALIPDCKGLFGEIRIFEKGELIWTYTRSHKYPQYIGPGTYNRLARRFILENTLEPDASASEAEAEAKPESQSEAGENDRSEDTLQ